MRAGCASAVTVSKNARAHLRTLRRVRIACPNSGPARPVAATPASSAPRAPQFSPTRTASCVVWSMRSNCTFGPARRAACSRSSVMRPSNRTTACPIRRMASAASRKAGVVQSPRRTAQPKRPSNGAIFFDMVDCGDSAMTAAPGTSVAMLIAPKAPIEAPMNTTRSKRAKNPSATSPCTSGAASGLRYQSFAKDCTPSRANPMPCTRDLSHG